MLILSIFFVSCEEKDCYHDFAIGQVGFGSHSQCMQWRQANRYFGVFSIFEFREV